MFKPYLKLISGVAEIGFRLGLDKFSGPSFFKPYPKPYLIFVFRTLWVPPNGPKPYLKIPVEDPTCPLHGDISAQKRPRPPATTVFVRNRRSRSLNRTRIYPRIGPSAAGEATFLVDSIAFVYGAKTTVPDKNGRHWGSGSLLGPLPQLGCAISQLRNLDRGGNT